MVIIKKGEATTLRVSKKYLKKIREIAKKEKRTMAGQTEFLFDIAFKELERSDVNG